MARWFVVAGIILILVGAILHFAPGILNWFGKLPGDINIRSEGSRVFIPHYFDDYCQRCINDSPESVQPVNRKPPRPEFF